VEFKSHPYYDDSDARDWLYLRPDDWTEPEPGAEKALQELLRADKQWLCDLALDRIRAAAGESYLAERPHPEVNEFLFFPIGEQGYQVYVEYVFLQQPDASSPDSDFWWAIINCPYAVAESTTGRREAYVIGLGWLVA
jgi:hypothetical protein